VVTVGGRCGGYIGMRCATRGWQLLQQAQAGTQQRGLGPGSLVTDAALQHGWGWFRQLCNGISPGTCCCCWKPVHGTSCNGCNPGVQQVVVAVGGVAQTSYNHREGIPSVSMTRA
jgi:hypothetical protein